MRRSLATTATFLAFALTLAACGESPLTRGVTGGAIGAGAGRGSVQ